MQFISNISALFQLQIIIASLNQSSLEWINTFYIIRTQWQIQSGEWPKWQKEKMSLTCVYLRSGSQAVIVGYRFDSSGLRYGHVAGLVTKIYSNHRHRAQSDRLPPILGKIPVFSTNQLQKRTPPAKHLLPYSPLRKNDSWKRKSTFNYELVCNALYSWFTITKFSSLKLRFFLH